MCSRLTAFSAGSSIHTYDDNLQVAWYHQFNAATQNEARAQWDYNSFNVIPNEPAEVGLQIPVLSITWERIFSCPTSPSCAATNSRTISPSSAAVTPLKFGGYEILRGNHTESHTFFPGRFVFGSLPGEALSPCFAPTGTNPCTGAATPSGANINSLQAAGLGPARDLPAGLRRSDLRLLRTPSDSVLRPGLLADSVKLYSELRPPLRT